MQVPASVFPGDTFGIATLSPTQLVLSWGSAVPGSHRQTSVFAAPVSVVLGGRGSSVVQALATAVERHSSPPASSGRSWCALARAEGESRGAGQSSGNGGEQAPCAWHPFERMFASIGELDAGARNQILDRR